MMRAPRNENLTTLPRWADRECVTVASDQETNMSLSRTPFHSFSAAVTLVAGVALASAMAMAQTPPAPPPQGVPENAVTRVSEHVYAIVGNPNIAIVNGYCTTPVFDT